MKLWSPQTLQRTNPELYLSRVTAMALQPALQSFTAGPCVLQMQVATGAQQATEKVCQAASFSLHSPGICSEDLGQLWAGCQQQLADCVTTQTSLTPGKEGTDCKAGMCSVSCFHFPLFADLLCNIGILIPFVLLPNPLIIFYSSEVFMSF